MARLAEEYAAVRENVGWWERREVGFLAVSGPDRFTWLQGMVSNDTRLLANGSVERLPVCLLDATGHLLSDGALVFVPGGHPLASAVGRAGQDFLLLELPHDNTAQILTHLDRLLIMEDVELTDVSAKVRCLTLQGPLTGEFYRPEAWGARTERGAALWNLVDGSSRAVQADHTGSGGLDLYMGVESLAAVRDTLHLLKTPEVGGETAELLRVEAGIPRYGVDMDASVLAPEANLSTHISLTKGCYVGQEIVARIDARGHTNRALTGLLLTGETLPASGAKLFFPSESEPPRETGRLTSLAAASPATGGQAIALGYVRHEHRAPGTRLTVGEAGAVTVRVTELPFYRKPSL